VHVHARETIAKLRELSHAGVSGMYYSCIHVPNVAVNPGIIVSFISSYLILRDFLHANAVRATSNVYVKAAFVDRNKKERKKRTSFYTQAIFICCYYLITGFICAIDFTSVFKMTLS